METLITILCIIFFLPSIKFLLKDGNLRRRANEEVINLISEFTSEDKNTKRS